MPWRLQQANGRPLRLPALKREVGDVTQRMLTLTLRKLERKRLIARDYHPEIPPRVEYAITELGSGALEALQAFKAWRRHNLPQIQAHRRFFDDRE